MNNRIFSIEDDKDIAHILSVTLKKQGYDVTSFPDGKSFFEAFKKEKPEMILLDMMLPDIQGSEILKIIRNNHQNDDIDIIIISANRMVMDKVDGLDLGADDYIEKPFDLLELMSRVNSKFRRRKRDIIEYKDIKMDLQNSQVFFKGIEIMLTQKEFEILKLLVQNPGKVFSREELLNTIWGIDYLETRTVDMHIKAIRKKTNDDLIISVYGIGYRIS